MANNHAGVHEDFGIPARHGRTLVKDYRISEPATRKTLPYDLAGETQIQVQLTAALRERARIMRCRRRHDDPIPWDEHRTAASASGMFESIGKAQAAEGLEAQLDKALAT